ncbi:MAG: phosphatase PAP2 family protein [Chitinophagaceae bacterium]
MQLKKFIGLVFLLYFFQPSVNAQSLSEKYDSIRFASTSEHPIWKQLILPAGLITYGALAIHSNPLLSVNNEYKEEIYLEHQHKPIHADNYLQFAPAIAVFGLNIAGIKGKSNLVDASMIYLLSNILLNSSVTIVKHTSHELRPDGSDYYSFPSGHTAEAFASAEFLRQEYKNISAWYGIAGYTSAVITGFLRTYNNKHWLNDVIAGAGFGIASTHLAYWLYPKIKHLFYKDKPMHSFILPSYGNGSYSLNFIYKL